VILNYLFGAGLKIIIGINIILFNLYFILLNKKYLCPKKMNYENNF